MNYLYINLHHPQHVPPLPSPHHNSGSWLFSSCIIPSLGGYCVSRIYSMWPLEMAFVTRLYAVSSVVWSAVLMGWSMLPSSEHSIESTTPVSPVIYCACTFKNDWNKSERDAARDSGLWGCGSLCDDTWCHVVPVRSPTPWSHFKSPPTPGGQTCFSSFFAHEGVLSHGPASRSRKQQGWDAPWDPWYSVPSQTSPVPRAFLRLCISFASEAP